MIENVEGLSQQQGTNLHVLELTRHYTRQAFSQLDIDIDRLVNKPIYKQVDQLTQVQLQENLLKFIGLRLFDRGMLKELPVISEALLKDVPTEIKDDVLKYYSKLRAPARVFSSGAADWLFATGYQPVWTFDVVNLFGANQSAGSIVGDYLLRDICSAVVSELGTGFELMRSKGDQFVLFKKGAQISKKDQNEIKKRIVQRLFSASGKENKEQEQINEKRAMSIYRKKAKIVFDRSKVKFSPPPERSQQKIPNISFEERKERLKNYHEELKNIINSLPDLGKEENEVKIIDFIEKLVYDSLLDDRVEEFRKDKNVDIQIFKDYDDFAYHHAKQREIGKLPENISFIRFEIPGVPKKINDDTNFGFKIVDEFLKGEQLKSILAAVEGSGIKSIKILRRGVDFFFAIPQTDSASDQTEKFLSELNTRMSKKYSFKNDGKVVSLPLFSSFGRTEIKINGNEEINKKSFDKAMEEVFNLTWKDSKRKIVNYFKSEQPNLDDWDFLSYFLSPFEKRGLIRLAKMGFGENEINRTKRFYKKKNFKKEEIEEYKSFLLKMKVFNPS